MNLKQFYKLEENRGIGKDWNKDGSERGETETSS